MRLSTTRLFPLALMFALHVARDHVQGQAPSCEELAAEARMPMAAVVTKVSEQ